MRYERCILAAACLLIGACGDDAGKDPGSTPYCSSMGDRGRGYEETIFALGGQSGSICQADLADTFTLIMRDIVGSASTIVLTHVPISLSLAVAREDKSTMPSAMVALPRSHTDGFDYSARSNSIVFYDQDFSQPPYDLTVSYERWVTTVIPSD